MMNTITIYLNQLNSTRCNYKMQLRAFFYFFEESLTCNVDFKMMCSLGIEVLFLSKYLNKIKADCSPILNAGCCMVVNEGFKSGAVCKLEKKINFDLVSHF